MENTTIILTIREVVEVLRCSKAHVQKALVGKIAGVPQLAHLTACGESVVWGDFR
jgi:predicted DNA-binding transcriptional regulator AlpA